MIACNVSLLFGKNVQSVPSGSSRCDTIIVPSIQTLESELWRKYGINQGNYYLLCNGRKYDMPNYHEVLSEDILLHVVPKILGGKGGFGSMLRAIGAQIEKTTNREACRDLSGRRLRDINEEQRLKNWIAQQAEREKEAVERKQKKLERLCQEPKHEFKDDKYDEVRSVMTETMSSSVEQGFKASSSSSTSQKRKSEDSCKSAPKPKAVKKKKTLWIDSEDSDASSVEDDTQESNCPSTSTVALKS